MTIKEGLKLKGTPAEIPGATRNDLPHFFKEMGYKVGAEIGSYEGEFTEKFCKAGLKMYAIDPWEDNKPHYSGNKKFLKQLDKAHEICVRRLSPYDCLIIKKTSMEAVGDFEDESLDFVYIDGNHTFRFIAEDLYEWSKKVRKGGVVAGHDYYVSKYTKFNYSVHVKYVVNAFTKTFKIKNWYVLGKRFAPDRDTWRSFFWIRE